MGGALGRHKTSCFYMHYRLWKSTFAHVYLDFNFHNECALGVSTLLHPLYAQTNQAFHVKLEE